MVQHFAIQPDHDELQEIYSDIDSMSVEELYEQVGFSLLVLRRVLSKLGVADINLPTSDGDVLHFCCNSIITGTVH
jgi:hypothetical protein